MYESHGVLIEPPDHTVLWRYLDFPKFFSLLESGSLFVPRITSFQDPFEGHPPRSLVEDWRHSADGVQEPEATNLRQQLEQNLQFFGQSRKLICASCWHANQQESAAMWNLYVRAGDGIAIRTTFARIKEALKATPINVMGGLVSYVDFDTFTMPGRINLVQWATLKRKSFEHEREFRLLTIDTSGSPGLSVPVGVEALIADVYVSPTSPSWLVTLLGQMMKRYRLDRTVIQSALYDEPEYLLP